MPSVLDRQHPQVCGELSPSFLNHRTYSNFVIETCNYTPHLHRSLRTIKYLSPLVLRLTLLASFRLEKSARAHLPSSITSAAVFQWRELFSNTEISIASGGFCSLRCVCGSIWMVSFCYFFHRAGGGGARGAWSCDVVERDYRCEEALDGFPRGSIQRLRCMRSFAQEFI